jgi:hypothetical protein
VSFWRTYAVMAADPSAKRAIDSAAPAAAERLSTCSSGKSLKNEEQGRGGVTAGVTDRGLPLFFDALGVDAPEVIECALEGAKEASARGARQ